MVVVDGTAVVVAFPTIKSDLRIPDSDLGWIVNAFYVPYAGFRLVAGRAGDVFGHRGTFLVGLIAFSAASVGCVLGQSALPVLACRGVQGVGGALIVTSGMSLLVSAFDVPAERARALAIYNSINAAGAAMGLLIGGVLVKSFGWKGIFWINAPIGVVMLSVCSKYLITREHRSEATQVDIYGATVATLALVLAVYSITVGAELGWRAPKTLILGSTSVILLLVFLRVEACVNQPLIPLRVFRYHRLVRFCAINMLFSVAVAAINIASLFFQRVLGYDPVQTGMAFIPFNLSLALFSLGSPRILIDNFGVARTLAVGLSVITAALTVLGLVSVDTSEGAEFILGLALLGLGIGIAICPLMVGAMQETRSDEAGLASGFFGTSSAVGRAIGVAFLTSISAAKTHELLSSGAELSSALRGGYQIAFMVGASTVVSAVFLTITVVSTNK